MERLVLVIMVVTTTAACGLPAHAVTQLRSSDGSFDRILNVSGNVDLEVDTSSGRIEIRRGPDGRVAIHGTIHASSDWFGSYRDVEDAIRRIEANPPLEQNGNNIRIGPDRYRFEHVSISYELVVPEHCSVRSHTGSGSQTIEGIDGSVDVSTGSGRITLDSVRGNVTAGTGSGSITANSLRGEFRGHTGSGHITAEGEQTGRWDLETGSGGVEIRLPQTAAFDLSAHTGSGGVTVDRPLTVQGNIGRHSRTVHGRVNGGGYPLDVRTGSGHIHIE